MLHKPLNDTVLSGGVPTFQDDEDLVIALDKVALELDELDLQVVQVVLIGLLCDRGLTPARIWFSAFLAHGEGRPCSRFDNQHLE
jgi:hypothetical protein